MATRCRPLLGAFVEITAPDGADAAVQSAFEAVAHVHARMSFHEADSDLGRLRRAQAGDVVEVDRATAQVLRLAGELFAETDGLFDVGIGRALAEAGFLPRDGLGDLADYSGDGGDIEVLDDTHIRLARRTLVDLGGIAKGYAVDRAVETLMAAGVAEGVVNAGGDLRVFGARPHRVGLRDADGRVRQVLELQDGALASSANLHTRRREGGRTASPHIGPGGAPVLAARRVSVVAPTAMLADAMTKIALADRPLADRLLADRGGQALAEPSQAEAA